MSERHVEVVLRWGGDVVEVKRLIDEDSLTVGRLPSDDLFLPLEEIASFELLKRGDDGSWRLTTGPGVSGTITRLGQSSAVSPLTGASVALDDDTSAALVAGPFSLEVRRADRARVAVLAPIFDVLWANTATVSLFGMAAFVAVFTLLPQRTHDDADDLIQNQARFSTLVMHVTPPAKATSVADAASASSQAKPKPVAKPAPSTSKAPRPPQPKQSDAEVVNGKLASLFGEGGGFATLVGDGGVDQMADLVGSINGNRSADARGGLGLVGAGPGGAAAGVGIIGTGKVGTHGKGSGEAEYGDAGGLIGKKTTYAIDIPTGPPVIVGSLDKEIIRRVVHEHINQVRACYERALQSTPGLEAKVGVKWVIGPSGRVASSAITGTSGDDDLDGCIARHVRTWVFPAPKGGGDVVVNYPFVVKRGG